MSLVSPDALARRRAFGSNRTRRPERCWRDGCGSSVAGGIAATVRIVGGQARACTSAPELSIGRPREGSPATGTLLLRPHGRLARGSFDGATCRRQPSDYLATGESDLLSHFTGQGGKVSV